MIRRVFKIVAALSLLVFAATVVLSIIGTLHVVWVTFERGGRVWVVGFTGDHAWATSVADWPAGSIRPGESVNIFPAGGFRSWSMPGCWADWGGARAVTGDGRVEHAGAYTNVGVMFWPVLIVSGVVPLAWVADAWKRRRRLLMMRQGRCPACGYDLRASTERCPECGANIQTDTAAAA